MRLRIDLAYDGTDFYGWAAQPALRTVEGELSTSLATVLRVPSVNLVCAGRTDSGVHARGQVVHCDIDKSPGQLLRRLNGILPPDIRVRRVVEAPEGFDARFSALWRRYAYRIADSPAAVDPLLRRQVLSWPRVLDLDAMNEASRALLGLHDFASFCKQRPGATTIRTLQELEWSRGSDGIAIATVRADAFCHSMVRSLVGCVVAIGEGRQTPEWAAQVLTAGTRDSAVKVVRAHGLTLEEVGYPADEEMAEQAQRTRTRRDG